MFNPKTNKAINGKLHSKKEFLSFFREKKKGVEKMTKRLERFEPFLSIKKIENERLELLPIRRKTAKR